MPHNIGKFTTSLSAKLATRSRHVCLFLGAGASKACGLPDVSGLQKSVLAKLKAPYKALFEKQLTGRNLEQALSRVRRIAALLSGNDVIDGLNVEAAKKLDELVCNAIVEGLDTSTANLQPVIDLAAWVGRTEYHLPIEIFTVNYDLLLEKALEAWQVAYFDGFIGTLAARFRDELVDASTSGECMPAFFARLWKLHGSLNWEWDSKHQIVRRGSAVESSAAIYPSDTKYDESRRMPFIVLQDRFRRALHQPESLTLISGYSFGDDHLNEIIYDAASRRERSEIVAFCFSDIPGELADRAARTPNLQIVTGVDAIIGGVRDAWSEPDDELFAGLWGNGKFILHDFTCLAAYLAKSVLREDEALLVSKLAKMLADPAAQAVKATNA